MGLGRPQEVLTHKWPTCALWAAGCPRAALSPTGGAGSQTRSCPSSGAGGGGLTRTSSSCFLLLTFVLSADSHHRPPAPTVPERAPVLAQLPLAHRPPAPTGIANTRGLTECLLSTPSLHFLLPSLAQLSKCHLNHLLTPKSGVLITSCCITVTHSVAAHDSLPHHFCGSGYLQAVRSPGVSWLQVSQDSRGDLFPSSLMWFMVASGPHWWMPETWKGPRRSSQRGSSFPERESGPQPARRKSQRER